MKSTHDNYTQDFLEIVEVNIYSSTVHIPFCRFSLFSMTCQDGKSNHIEMEPVPDGSPGVGVLRCRYCPYESRCVGTLGWVED